MSTEVKPEHFVIELGPLPENWGVRPLAEVGRWYSGGTPSMKNSAYWSGNIPWVSPKDMKVSRLYDAVDHISAKAVADGARLLPAGTVLMVIRGMILAHSFPVARAERPLAFNQDMKALVVCEEIDSEYVLHWLIGHAQALRGLTTESTHGTKRLPPEMLYRVALPLPPTKAEQEAIAGALSDADALIASLEQLVAKKRQIKHGAMQELLTGQTRLPEFTGEWEVRPLGTEINELEAGVSVNSEPDDSDADSDTFAILKTSCVEKGAFLPWECKPISRRDIGRATLSPRANTILISRMNTIDLVGECGYVARNYDYLYVPDRLWLTRFRTNAAVSPRWLSYVLSSRAFREQLKGIATGTSGSMKNIAKGSLLGLTVAFPSMDEQSAIAAILTDMDAEIAVLEDKLAKARQIKQGMMQELLTGRIRLVG